MARAFRILAALAVLIGFAWSHAHAQIPLTGAGRGAPTSGGGFTPSCAQSSTFLAAATGVTLTADKTNYDTLICGLVSDGVWNFDVLYIFAAPSTTNAALINLANPGTFNGTTNGTVNFTAYQGYTGDGSTFNIDSGFNPVVAPSPNYVKDSAQVGVYVLSNFTSGGASYSTIGAATGANVILAPYFFGNAVWSINDTTNNSTVSSTTQGQWSLTRTGASALALYKNGNTTAFGTSTTTSVSLPNSDILFFSYTSNFSAVQASAGWIRNGLSNVDTCKVNNRINTYMTAYSINVYTNGAC